MGTRTRRRFTAEHKAQAVGRLSEPGAMTSGVAAELGLSPTQLRIWRLEQEAAGSAEAIAHQKAEAAELRQSTAPGFAGTPLTAYREPMEVMEWTMMGAEKSRRRCPRAWERLRLPTGSGG